VHHQPTRGGARASVEAEMFFPRLRRQAKWVFVFLALVFGLGFVFFGVGSGSSGIEDLLRGNFDIFGSGTTSASKQVKDARKRTEQNPRDAQAWRDLATALQTDSKPDEAITALERYRALRPKDVDALNELAALYLRRADEARTRASAIQQASQGALASQIFQVDPNSRLGQALQGTANPLTGADPINRAVQQSVNEQASSAYSDMSSAYNKSVSVYTAIAKVSPKDPSVQFQLAQAAEAAGDTATAIKAYKAFIELAPDDPSAPAVRQRVKQLQTPQPSVSAGG
jgi:tetratricopeptide (TPR) repeat protein